jgi:hypothetical protein
MTLDEAIDHCNEVISRNPNGCECAVMHNELLGFLIELQELRRFKTGFCFPDE